MPATTVLVTGANGFVGSHILEALTRREGIAPLAACRDRRKLPPGYSGEVREDDLRNPIYLQDLLEGADVVCHAAAWTSV
jgi:nucleoside-diphosphate-sugar epimerase